MGILAPCIGAVCATFEDAARLLGGCLLDFFRALEACKDPPRRFAVPDDGGVYPSGKFTSAANETHETCVPLVETSGALPCGLP